jgi:hypothetical protein
MNAVILNRNGIKDQLREIIKEVEKIYWQALLEEKNDSSCFFIKSVVGSIYVNS